jgi:hypothetical protein
MAKSFGTIKKMLLDFLDRADSVTAKRYCDTIHWTGCSLACYAEASSLNTTEPSSELTTVMELVMALRLERTDHPP